MVWIKRLNNSDNGDATHLGGDSWDALDSYFDNTDISASLTNPTVINTTTTFKDGKLLIRNTEDTFSYTLKSGTLTGNSNVYLPTTSGNVTLVAAGAANDWSTEMQTFRNTKIKIMNPAATSGYIFATSAVIADRTITLPLLTGNDTLTLNDFLATLKNKTINIDENTIKHSSTNGEGDILIYDQTAAKYIRLAKGTSSQVLTVKSDGTDIEWATPSAPGGDTIYSDMKTASGFKYGLFNGTGTSTALSGYGLLGSLTNLGGTPTAYIDTTNGYQGLSWPVTSSSTSYGFRTSGAVTIRKLNPDITICFQLDEQGDDTGSRLWIGLGVDAAETLQDSNYLDSDIGIFLSKSSSDNFFKITYNDGDATQHNTASLGTSDSLIHTIRFYATEASSKWSYSFDGAAAVDLSTDIPGATDSLYVFANASMNDATSRNWRVYWAKMRQKERA